jgi:hypothetical protein
VQVYIRVRSVGCILVVCSIHICSLSYQKFANARVATYRRQMQWRESSEKSRLKTLQKKKIDEWVFLCVCVGLGIILIAHSIHICSLFYEKLTNARVSSSRRQMQWRESTKKSRLKTLKKRNIDECIFMCVCVGPHVIPIVCSIHNCSLFYEKLADARVAF